MSNTVAKAFYQVYIDGRQYLNKILSLRVSHGYGQDYAEGIVNVTADMPSTVGKWSNIVIIMGGTSGTSFTRFNGFVSDFDLKLYPVSIGIICKGSLARAEGVAPLGGTEIDFSGMTDEDIVSTALTNSNITPANQNIQGTGKVLGTTATDPDDKRFKQAANQDSLSVIKQYDQISLGYRTTDSASGVVIRPLVNNIPTADPAIILTEGIDIFDASAKITLKAPPNALEVQGFESIFSYSQFNDWTPPNLQFLTAQIRSNLIESNTASEGVGISAEEVAQYFSGQWFDYKVECEVTTYRSDLLAPGQTAEIHAPTRLRLSHYLFWLHTIVTEIGEDGAFTQTLSLTSELTDNAPFTPVPLPGILPTTPTANPPADAAYNVDFTIIAIDKEKVIIADVETDLYIVYVEDLSTSTSTTQDTRTWTASAGGLPSTGSDQIFVTSFQDLNAASITLEHTYVDAHVASVTKNMIDFVNNVGVKTRKIYTAASSEFEAYDGETWRTDAPSTGTVVVAGDGPIAGTGTAPIVPTCTGGPVGGDADIFVYSSFVALLTDNSWEDRSDALSTILSDNSVTITVKNISATDASNITIIAIDQGSPPVPFTIVSTDGGATWTLNTGSLLGENILVDIQDLAVHFRASKYHVFQQPNIGGDGSDGGHFESADGLTWSRVDSLPQKFGSEWIGADYWIPTASHRYYIMRGDSSGSGEHSIMVDSESGTPETQRLSTTGTVSGGTFTISFGAESTSALAFNASAGDIQTALEAFVGIGVGVSCTGSLAGDDLDITFPFNGNQPLLTIDNFSITGGGSITVAEQTGGTAGIKTYPLDVTVLQLFGSVTGDVALLFGHDALGNIFIDKLIGTATPVDVTPAIFTHEFDTFGHLVSPDGVTWLGVYINGDDATSQLMLSQDSGDTWALVGPVATWSIPAIAFDPSTSDKWWAVIKDTNAVASLYVSVDNGSTWADSGADTTFINDVSTLIPIGGHFQ